MANPQQRRKAKSGTSTKPSGIAKRKIKKRLNRAPSVHGPDVLKEHWDPKLTVRQNYANLGLVPTLSGHQSGGLDRLDPYHSSNLANLPVSTTSSGKVKKGMAKIVRDEDGNIVEVIEANDDEEETPWGKPLKDIDDIDSDEIDNRMPAKLTQSGQEGQVVQALEKLADDYEPVQRHTSDLEKNWLADLVQKYDQDIGAMVKDRQLNIWQKTPGEIRRAINKAGGFNALRS